MESAYRIYRPSEFSWHEGVAGGCVLDFGSPTFSAGVVYRRDLLGCHSGVFYELQGNN